MAYAFLVRSGEEGTNQEIPLGSSLFFPTRAILERDHLTKVDNVKVRDAFGVRSFLKLVIISFFFLITSPNTGYFRMHLGELEI